MDVNASENNCFWEINAVNATETAKSQNEVFLYDEAEPLAYGCSETSLPPKIATKQISDNQGIETRDSENVADASDNSAISVLCGDRSQYFSVQSLQKCVTKNCLGRNIMQRNESGRTGVAVVGNFQSEILSKFNEFSNSSKSLPQRITDYFKDSTDECENTDNSLRSVKTVSRKKGSKVKEIFARKRPIMETSSDSDCGQSGETQLDDVLSTGASEISEVGRNRGKTDGTVEELSLHGKNSDVQWLTSKSIVKVVMGDGKTTRETHDSTKRVSPPQRKLSIKHMNANPTPCLLVEEIKRNNLVIKEDIFSSSKSQNLVVAEPSNHEKIFNAGEGHDHEITQQHPAKMKDGAVEVYEAKGCRGRRETKSPETQEMKAVQHQAEFESAPEVQRVLIQQTECARMNASKITGQVRNSENLKNVGISQLHTMMKSIGINTEESTHSNSLPSVHNSNETKTSKVTMPTSGSSRYVKLPGYPEAFVRDDKYVQELRIKDGLSFESVNNLNVSTLEQDSSKHEIMFVEGREAAEEDTVKEQEREKCVMVMIDESTGFESPMEHRLTQTSTDVLTEKMTADTSVQCIIDSIPGSSDYKNDHQEIMICDDHAKGVQLYNILGHPLTDMEGYLLKDSHGRFLVRFDNFGVPTTCTDGKTIFLEDGTKWENLKGYFNIIHQRFKKKLSKTPENSRQKRCQHRRHFDSETGDSPLEWLDDGSTYSLSNNYSAKCTLNLGNDRNPLKHIKTKPDSGNIYDNTSNLMTEMKSIAKLRNALLEKINFIADNRGPQKPQFSQRNETRSFKSMKRSDKQTNSETYWKSEPRINSHCDRMQRNQKFKCNRMIKKRKDIDENSFFGNTTTNFRRSPHVAPTRATEAQEVFPATASLWHPEPPVVLHSSNALRWKPQLSSSSGLTIVTDENFPLSSGHSVFGPWSDVSRSSSNVQPMTQQTQKWSATMPSIEGDSDENEF